MRMCDVTDEIRNEVIELYKNNHSRHEIRGMTWDKYHFHTRSINQILTEAGLELVSFTTSEHRQRRNKYGLTKDYFDDINTPIKAYILGLLAADGCNVIERNTISIGLQEQDKYLLEEIEQELHYTKPLKRQEGVCELHGSNTKHTSYYLDIFSKHMCERLLELNVPPRKSFTVEFPPKDEIPTELVASYILGYFDGNGTVCFNQTENYTGRLYSRVQIVSASITFIKQLRNFVLDEWGIKSYYRQKSDNVAYAWTINKREDVLNFLDIIYKDCPMHLNRKYEKYLFLKDYCNNKYPIMNNSLTSA